MIFPRQQNWRTSTLPYSISLANDVHTGVSFDTPSRMIAESKRWATAGMQGFGARRQYPNRGMDGHCGCGSNGNCGCSGLHGLTFDGTGLFGTGIFSDLNPFGGNWSWPEWSLVGVGVYMLYASIMQGKQTKYRLEGAAQRRRKSRAARYRAKAKKLEDAPLGGIFGF